MNAKREPKPKFRPCEMAHHFHAGVLPEASDECPDCGLRLCLECMDGHQCWSPQHPDLALCHFCGDEHEKRSMEPDGCGGWTCQICIKGMEATEND